MRTCMAVVLPAHVCLVCTSSHQEHMHTCMDCCAASTLLLHHQAMEACSADGLPAIVVQAFGLSTECQHVSPLYQHMFPAGMRVRAVLAASCPCAGGGGVRYWVGQEARSQAIHVPSKCTCWCVKLPKAGVSYAMQRALVLLGATILQAHSQVNAGAQTYLLSMPCRLCPWPSLHWAAMACGAIPHV